MRVLVNGAHGKMGHEVCKAVRGAMDLELVGGVDPAGRPQDDLRVFTDLTEALKTVKPDVVVDFTTPAAVQGSMEVCLAHNVPMVIGTTGFKPHDLAQWQARALQENWKAIIAPNFAIGAVLMMRFARDAVRFFDQAEIIEYHHAEKLDAPSGTALRTRLLMEEVHQKEIPIHSVRLPGLVAHQEVILGLPGQTLTLRHDSNNRESFMPGVLLAIRQVPRVKGLVIGLEHILFTDI
ncbi:MAG: 4-hydroxy-tetrahydrodipicolinate reductase [Firmicutes bacterium]|jgi:4-hydroxy-tetrahydrodipicolinate reductase|nr:4-hydroxy-tetrahydrodipicolinate reductase [Bacillota bacterium]NLL08449.1 4-hydroxy-tetrahydrodipicolinate reductase [Bacillota bacterium]HBG09070.1 4-hydroxy-tetrahydrodipicolinate reductase [Bacillota bacterium]